MTTLPSTWYRMDTTRIVCPLPLIPMDLFVTRAFCGEEVAPSLLHYQREAHRVGYVEESDPPWENRTPSHCLKGLPPPWIAVRGVSYMPEAIQWVTNRYLEGKQRFAPRLFAAEALLMARKMGTPLAPTRTVFQPRITFLFDVFAVWASYCRKWPVTEEQFQAWRCIAEQDILQEVQHGGQAKAQEIAMQICTAIEINFTNAR